jgi:hypothetical protein
MGLLALIGKRMGFAYTHEGAPPSRGMEWSQKKTGLAGVRSPDPGIGFLLKTYTPEVKSTNKTVFFWPSSVFSYLACLFSCRHKLLLVLFTPPRLPPSPPLRSLRCCSRAPPPARPHAQAPKTNNFAFLSRTRVLIVAGHGGQALLTHNQGLSQRWVRFEAPQKGPP